MVSQGYNIVLLGVSISLGFSLLLMFLSHICSISKKNYEKLSAYECGFESYGSARIAFNIHFYLIAILFIIFDLEVVFLFPWCMSAGLYTIDEMLPVFNFIAILGIGFIYEWNKKALTFN